MNPKLQEQIDKAGGVRAICRHAEISTHTYYNIIKKPHLLRYDTAKKLEALGIDPELFFAKGE